MTRTREQRVAERQEAARSREKRYRSLNYLLRLPATRDIDRCVKTGVVDWLHERGIVDPGDIMRLGVIVDAQAASLLRHIVHALQYANVDTSNKIARDRMWRRLQLKDRAQINTRL
jgi:hypothetical protein